MVSLSTGPLSSHPHQSVALTFFDCAVRYAKHIPPPSSQPQFLVAILTAYLDARGLRHPSLAVRKRVAISFSKFVRALRTSLYPFLDSIVSSLQELLVISFEVQKNVPFDDQVCPLALPPLDPLFSFFPFPFFPFSR
jgi:exportin-T